MPACVVEHEIHGSSLGLRHILSKGIEKDLKHISVAVGHEKADKVPVLRTDSTDHIEAQMASMVSLRRTTPAFSPFVSRVWIALKVSLIAKKNMGASIGKQQLELLREFLSPRIP